MDLQALVYAAAIFFFIFDPFATLPVFISSTKGLDEDAKVKSANKAILVSIILFVIFVLIGNNLLQIFDISISAFKLAGGIILFLLALEIIFGLQLGGQGEKNVAWVVIASPLLTGPGVMTTAIVLAGQHGYLLTILAGLPVLLFTWFLLRNASLIVRFLGDNVIDITSRIIGLLVAAMGAEFVLSGVMEYAKSNGVYAILRLIY
ncbi:MAG: MarC family protein [Methanomassiliicoccales archaeon]|nr:MarC family protein [Methanomassiliicoccales archaeon]NYT15620.1 MarC family protein [Methanomassiliicoccales archaeon]